MEPVGAVALEALFPAVEERLREAALETGRADVAEFLSTLEGKQT
jgi:hypothetical protein